MANIKNLIENYSNLQNTLITVKIAGKNTDFDCTISSMEFDASTNGEASVCIVRWVSECYKNDKLVIKDSFNSAQIGAKFEVSAGYYNDDGYEYSVNIFSGFIFSTSIDIQQGISYFEISGMDGKVWMMANRFTQFKSSEQTYSKIVKDIQSKYSSKFSGSQIEISGEPRSIRPGLYQCDESDFDYLRRIAEITGSLFYVLDGKFMFTTIKPNNSKKITITPICEIADNKFIKKVNFKSNIVGIPKSISVNFTNNEKYKNSSSANVNSSSKIGKGNTADKLTNNISSNNTVKIFNNSINSSECAKFVANAEYSKRAINLAKCEVICMFTPDIKIGASVQISDFGNMIDNQYIVTSLNHKYDGQNFITTMELSTDAYSSVGAPILGNIGSLLGGLSSFF